jgi:hypothetical protein
MKTTLEVNGKDIPLNRFVTSFLGNLVLGIAESLKEGEAFKSVSLEIDEKDVLLQADGQPIPVIKSFAKNLIARTVKRAIRSLRGTEGAKRIAVRVEMLI